MSANNKRNLIHDKFATIIATLEESLFEMEEISENESVSETEKEDIITAKELTESARNLCLTVIASYTGKKPPPKF